MKCVNCNREVNETENGLVHARVDSWPELIHCVSDDANEIVLGKYADVKIVDLMVYNHELDALHYLFGPTPAGVIHLV